MLATEYANYYELEPQVEDESNFDFKRRVSIALRKAGHLIEAHEAYQDARWDQNDNVLTGIAGAIAQAIAGVSYSGDPVGNDIAAGTIARHQMSPEGQKEQATNEMIAAMLAGGMSPDDIKSLLG